MSKWVEVWLCGNRVEAEVAKSALDSADIKAQVKVDDVGGMHPWLSFAHGVRLMVQEKDALDARKILESVFKGDGPSE
jgi:hypothetical protein